MQFQSLIGTIKTRDYKSFHDVVFFVSIPYRDDKNKRKKFYFLSFLLVSIPYRDDKNSTNLVFILMHIHISIPYRDDKNTQLQ